MRFAFKALLGVVLASGGLCAHAAEVRVMGSGAFMPAYEAVIPAFEKARGDHLVTLAGPSMGATPQAIPNRLARGEPADVVIMARGALDDLAAKGRVVPGSRTDLVRSRIALAVKAGAPRPDISTMAAFKRALLAAKSVAYSDSASGVYISTELFKRMGIADQMAAKSRMIPATPVGEILAKGEAEIGFQQLSELKPVAGIDIVGLIPAKAQKVTLFAAGVTTTAKQPKEARALIDYLASRAVDRTIEAAGLEPVNPAAK